MWSFLRRNQEPALVGTAITLVILALLVHFRPTRVASSFGGPVNASAAVTKSARGSGLSDVPREHEYYRAKWRQIANDFYAAHPVESDESSSRTAVPVVTASLSDRPAGPQNDADDGDVREAQSYIAPVSHEIPVVAKNSSGQVSSVVNPVRSQISFAGKPAVAAAFAAGLLAFMLFRSIWPASERIAKMPHRIVEGPSSLRIELPANWVTVRPTIRQRCKPIVLTISYVAAFVAAWSIYR